MTRGREGDGEGGLNVKLLHKLLALILLTSVVPLVAVALLLIDIGRGHVEESVRQVHRLEAHAAAGSVRQYLQQAEERLVADLEGSIDTMLDEDIQAAVVWMLGKQDNLLTFRILRVHDADGRPVGPPVSLPEASIPPAHRGDYLVTDADVEVFQARVPMAEALQTGQTHLSRVYVNRARREPLVAMAVPITDRVGQARWVVTGEVSLRQVQQIVSDVTIGTVGHAYLVDGEGRAIAHPRFDLVLRQESLRPSGVVERALTSTRPGALSFESSSGVSHLAAHAPVLRGGWQLIVQQPEADAYAPVQRMKLRALYILVVALMASLVVGALSVRSLVIPLREVMAGMRRIVDGQFRQRLRVRTRDEVGELADAFNVMGRMLQEYKDEIETWNRTLQERVEAKTRALESAQAQLVQSSKMSAVGQLGAGIAHELNNPLAGVVGQATLLRRRLFKLELAEEDRKRLEGYLEHIERESSRCREIIHGLLSFSQATTGGTDTLNLNESIERILLLVQNGARSSGVEISADLADDLPCVEANEQQVQQALMHLLTNAFQAMPDGGTAFVATRPTEDGIAITVGDTGRGIDPEHIDRIFDPFFTTKDVWQNTGLGLAVCYSIVESHGGRIEVESEVGRGTTFTIRLPRVGRPAEPPRDVTKEPVGLRRGRAVGAGA